jgi:putative endonuclease
MEFKREDKFYVYIVECNKGTYYTGYTNNLENRLKLHNDGKGAKYTRSRRPVRLIWHKGYKCLNKVLSEERKIKALTRAQKEKLIKNG